MKVSVKFVTVWRRDLSYPGLTDCLPFSNQSPQRRDHVAEIAFLSPKCLEGFFFFSKPGKRGGFVRACLEIKPLPSHRGETDARQHKGLLEVALHLDQREANMHTLFILKHTHTHIEETCDTLYWSRLVVIFSNDCPLSLFTSISSLLSLLLTSSCCIYDRLYSRFLFTL